MEEKEEKKVEIISAEMVDEVVNTIKKVKEEHPELKDGNTDTEKVAEVLQSLKGCTAHTVVGVISSALPLLSVDAIMACLNMGKSALKAKVLTSLMKLVDKCPAYSSEKATASDAPEATTK